MLTFPLPQLWYRRLPPSQPSLIEFGASPMTITSHEGWARTVLVFQKTSSSLRRACLAFAASTAIAIPRIDANEYASPPLESADQRGF